MVGLRSRFGLTASLLIGLQAVSACEMQFPLETGFSGVRAERDRQRQQPYHVVALSDDRAVISAKGRQVAIEPASGFCLAKNSVETSTRSAFALIGDCALDKAPDKSKRSTQGELQLPKSIPGIITVSVSGNPQLDNSGGLEGLEEFFKTTAGRKLLGRGDDPSAVEVKETRQIDDSIYVLVEDGGAGVLPVLSKRFWRGFVQVNDRLAVVTVSGFRARPLGKERMLKYLVDQVQTLSVANAEPLNERGSVQIADVRPERAEPPVESGAVALTDLKPEPLTVAVLEPTSTPVPQQRPDAQEEPASVEAASEDATASETATATAAAPEDAIKPEPEAEPTIEQAAATAQPPVKPTWTRPEPQETENVNVTAVESAPEVQANDDAGAQELATATQVNQPEARPGGSSDGAVEPATKFAPTSAPAAPKRPAV